LQLIDRIADPDSGRMKIHLYTYVWAGSGYHEARMAPQRKKNWRHACFWKL